MIQGPPTLAVLVSPPKLEPSNVLASGLVEPASLQMAVPPEAAGLAAAVSTWISML